MEWKEMKISGLLEVGDHSPSSSLVTNLLWDLAKSRFLDLEMAQTLHFTGKNTDSNRWSRLLRDLMARAWLEPRFPGSQPIILHCFTFMIHSIGYSTGS